ncbi:MAG TPA: hypothetical protein VM686_22025 [Polyangiaceae bacterium]|nr:hypothetical protein [Polyangiaceae bacterium]
MKASWTLLTIAVAAALFAQRGGHAPATPVQEDAGVPDGDLPDGDVPDSDLPDSDVPDGDAPDGEPEP